MGRQGLPDQGIEALRCHRFRGLLRQAGACSSGSVIVLRYRRCKSARVGRRQRLLQPGIQPAQLLLTVKAR